MFLHAALAYRRAGLAVIPCHRATKRPALESWRRYQRELPDLAHLRAWFGPAWHADALAILAGPVSGGLEVLDFDAPHLYPQWLTAVHARQPDLLDRLVTVRTPSGGCHVYYRTDVVAGNQKLAVDPAKPGGKYTLIETRGRGGYVLAPPTSGYTLLQGDLTRVAALSAAERDVLLAAARAFSRVEVAEVPATLRKPARKVPGGVLRPGDDYNARGDVVAMLERHGWACVRQDGETSYWRRPGKARGISATFNRGGKRGFYCFSTNAPPLEPERPYSPFGLYATLEHHGDFRAASRALRRDGYGGKE